MKIEYEINKEDIMIFNKLFLRKLYINNKFVYITLIIMLIFNILNYNNYDLLYVLIRVIHTLSIYAIVFIFIYFLTIYLVKRKIEKGDNFKFILCNTSLEIIDNNVNFKSKYNDFNMKFEEFEDLIETDKYFYLMIQKFNGFIIPKQTSTGDTKEVFEYLRCFTKQKN